mmetsp:Transcript_38617/g.111424  ORF Transcript_38617/g.111424 Transcript_38617/m.111424 type:complete len:375 (-) Transcript_38617:264-1388(-)
MQKEDASDAIVKPTVPKMAIKMISTENGTMASLSDLSIHMTNFSLPTNATTIASETMTVLTKATTSTGTRGIQKATNSCRWMALFAVMTMSGSSLSVAYSLVTISMYSCVDSTVLLPSIARSGSCLHSVESANMDSCKPKQVFLTFLPKRSNSQALSKSLSRSKCTRESVCLQFLSRATMPPILKSTTSAVRDMSRRTFGLLYTLRYATGLPLSPWVMTSMALESARESFSMSISEVVPRSKPFIPKDFGSEVSAIGWSFVRCGGLYRQKAQEVSTITTTPTTKIQLLWKKAFIKNAIIRGLRMLIVPLGNSFSPPSQLKSRTAVPGTKGKGRGPRLHTCGWQTSCPGMASSRAQKPSVQMHRVNVHSVLPRHQ